MSEYIESHIMKEPYDDLPMSFLPWCNKWFDLHKECPDYSILTDKEKKAYTKRIKGAGFDITLVIFYLSACCYPLVPCRKSIMRQLWFRFGENPKVIDLIPFVDKMGNDLYQNINGIKKKLCLMSE